jgi:hemolysin activation/secretion protein
MPTAMALTAVTMTAQTLPPPASQPQQSTSLSSAPRLFVREFQFESNHVFSAVELSKVTSPYTGRTISTEELEEARRAVTLYYVNRGYINSGAVIPDQDPTNGIVRIRVVEGVLSGINLQGNHWLRDGYIKSRVRRWSGPPLNLNQMQEGLQLLRQNPNVSQINAELKPGVAPGQGELKLEVTDQQPFRVGLQVDNERPPTVGAEQFWLLLADQNLTGNSDLLDFRYGIANAGSHGIEFSGVDNLEGSYTLPITPLDTTISFHGSRLNTSIIEEDFVSLDIKSVTESYGVVLRQPVYQTANREAAVSAGFDWRRNKTWLLGEPFDLSPGSSDGEMIVSVLRLSQEWIQRGSKSVLALRSTFNFGLDALDATDNGRPGEPNAKYFSWVGQGQYIQRLFDTQNEFVFRLSGQWTAESLLALEQFEVGGMQTVRGYLENQLVRDRGIVSSAEFRIPILFNKAGAGIVQLAPFFDFGGAWNVNGSPDPSKIYSIGSGLLAEPNKHFSAQIYWGYRLQHVTVPDEARAQGLGISFQLNVNAF